MSSIIYAFIGVVTVLGTIKVLSKIDEEDKIKLNNKERGILAILVFLFSIVINIKSIEIGSGIVYLYVIWYLFVTGYIDYKIKKVYCILNYITMIIALIFILYKVKIGIDVSFIIGSYIFYVLVVYFLGKLNCYAGGDSEIYIAIGYFIGSLYSGSALTFMILNIILSCVVLIILNIKDFDLRKFTFNSDKTIAFAPAIAISTLLLIVLK